MIEILNLYPDRNKPAQEGKDKKVVPITSSTPIMSFVTHDCLRFTFWVTQNLINEVFMVKMEIIYRSDRESEKTRNR